MCIISENGMSESNPFFISFFREIISHEHVMHHDVTKEVHYGTFDLQILNFLESISSIRNIHKF